MYSGFIYEKKKAFQTLLYTMMIIYSVISSITSVISCEHFKIQNDFKCTLLRIAIHQNIVNTLQAMSSVLITYQNLGCTPSSKEIKIVTFKTLT